MDTKPFVDQRVFLGNTPLFSNLINTDLDDLLSITHTQHFGNNSTVIRQGEAGEDMYIIESWSVDVRVHLADDEDVSLGKLSAGDAFGEIALFDHQPRTANIVTCEPCELLVLSRDVFNNFLLAHPHIALQLLSVMAKRTRATSDFLKDKMYSDVSSRLGETLTNIAHAYGRNTAKGLKIDMKFEDHELGKLAGIPSDVVSAQLRYWEKVGVVHKHFGCLTLLKPEELNKSQN